MWVLRPNSLRARYGAAAGTSHALREDQKSLLGASMRKPNAHSCQDDFFGPGLLGQLSAVAPQAVVGALAVGQLALQAKVRSSRFKVWHSRWG